MALTVDESGHFRATAAGDAGSLIWKWNGDDNSSLDARLVFYVAKSERWTLIRLRLESGHPCIEIDNGRGVILVRQGEHFVTDISPDRAK